VSKRGSWWLDYTEWLSIRSGELKAAPAKLASRKQKAQAKAPGTYVHAS
jgi:polyhydroxyalkanoate synthase